MSKLSKFLTATAVVAPYGGSGRRLRNPNKSGGRASWSQFKQLTAGHANAGFTPEEEDGPMGGGEEAGPSAFTANAIDKAETSNKRTKKNKKKEECDSLIDHDCGPLHNCGLGSWDGRLICREEETTSSAPDIFTCNCPDENECGAAEHNDDGWSIRLCSESISTEPVNSPSDTKET